VPFHRLLVEETGHGDLWLVTAGTLPAGLSLDPLTGALAGVPRAAAEGSFTVRVTANDEEGICYVLDEAEYSVRVSPQCVDDFDCAELVSKDFLEAGGAAACGDGGRCVIMNGCPNDPRQRVRFQLGGDAPPAPGEGGLITGGEVIRHARIQGMKNPDDLRRQVLVLFEEPGAAVLHINYTLPDNWPLPLREGDDVALRMETGPGGGEALRIEGPGGPSRLLAGFWVPGGLPDALSLPDLAALLPMGCPGFEDVCGTERPAAAVLSTADIAWTLAPSDTAWIPDPAQPEAGDTALLARVGWAMFREDVTPTPACAWAPPAEVSALFLPSDDCPGAVAKAESPQDLFAGQALAAPPTFEVSGWASFSLNPDNALVAALWTVEDDPVGGGFARIEALPQALPDPVGLGNRILRAGAAGEYRVGLSVEDQEGRTSCITDTIRFRVFPDPDVALRAELIWLPFDHQEAGDSDRLELYMRPSGSAAWDDPAQVCTPDSPLPELFEGAQCAAADLPGGLPALATLKTAAPAKTCGFALRAPETNTEPFLHRPEEGRRIILRLFCDTELLDLSLPEGFTLNPGDLIEVADIAPGCVLEPKL